MQNWSRANRLNIGYKLPVRVTNNLFHCSLLGFSGIWFIYFWAFWRGVCTLLNCEVNPHILAQVMAKRSRKNSDEPQQSKDVALSNRKKNCWTAVENFLRDFVDDDSIRTTVKKYIKWDRRKELVEEANERLNDSLFIWQKLSKSIDSSIMENTSFKNAFQTVELVLTQSKNPDSGSSPNQNPAEEDLQLTREELKFCKEDLMQKNAISDHMKQSVTDAKKFLMVSRMLGEVQNKISCMMMPDIEEPAKLVQGRFLQREDGQLMLNFPTPDSVQTNQSGKTDDIHDSEGFWDNLEDLLPNDKPGFSDAIAMLNEANMNPSSHKMSTVSSTVQGYQVAEYNAKALNDIFQQNPDIDKEFKLKSPYFQKVFMDKIAATYNDIEQKAWSFEQKDISRMCETVKDMEITGLKVTWLKNKLQNVCQEAQARVQEAQAKCNRDLIELSKINEALT